jgi:hypothetical protein
MFKSKQNNEGLIFLRELLKTNYFQNFQEAEISLNIRLSSRGVFEGLLTKPAESLYFQNSGGWAPLVYQTCSVHRGELPRGFLEVIF